MTAEKLFINRRALITGITGQDGSYLAELLLSKGYEVHGIIRRSSESERTRISSLISDKNIYEQNLFLHYADLDDITTIRRIFGRIQASEIYHLAGQSHVGLSFEIPESTCDFTAMGTLRLLEILRDQTPSPKFLNVGSSEIFGQPLASPQNEETPISPVTPYGAAKAFAVQMTRIYRQSYGLYACNAICYNHESPRRGNAFVTRKITRAAVRIKLGLQEKLELGNLNTSRDWGFAGDYVYGMWLMLQQQSPEDYVLATGKSTTVRDFLRMAFQRVGLNWQEHVIVNSQLIRPADSCVLVGDSTRARTHLNWKPLVTVEQLVSMMVDTDLSTIS